MQITEHFDALAIKLQEHTRTIMIRSTCYIYQFVKFTLWFHPLSRFFQTEVVILYRSAWASPHLHCRDLTQDVPGPWTQTPGVAVDRRFDLEGSSKTKTKLHYCQKQRRPTRAGLNTFVDGIVVLILHCIEMFHWEYIFRVAGVVFIVWRFAFRPCGWRCQSLGAKNCCKSLPGNPL